MDMDLESKRTRGATIDRRCLLPAATRGDAAAQTTLAVMHFNGEGGPQDFAEARRLLGLAAAQDHASAWSLLT